MTVERDHRDNPHPVMEIFKNFFLKLDHFLRTFCKKCIFSIENPKNTQNFGLDMVLTPLNVSTPIHEKNFYV